MKLHSRRIATCTSNDCRDLGPTSADRCAESWGPDRKAEYRSSMELSKKPPRIESMLHFLFFFFGRENIDQWGSYFLMCELPIAANRAVAVESGRYAKQGWKKQA